MTIGNELFLPKLISKKPHNTLYNKMHSMSQGCAVESHVMKHWCKHHTAEGMVCYCSFPFWGGFHPWPVEEEMRLQRWWNMANNSGHKRGNIFNAARRQGSEIALGSQAHIHSAGKESGRTQGGTKTPGRRWVSWQHPEVYSHVEWQLHLGVGQQLRGYGCHFRGHQYPCRGGRGTRVRRILNTRRKTHTYKLSAFRWK